MKTRYKILLVLVYLFLASFPLLINLSFGSVEILSRPIVFGLILNGFIQGVFVTFIIVKK